MAINARLQRYLDRTRSSYAVLPHREAYTAPEIARRAHVSGDQLAKVLIVRSPDVQHFMIVLPASRQLDLPVIERVMGIAGLCLEDERGLRRMFPDCEVGAMPPFGALYGLAMYLDPCLLEHEDIFFQAGNHHEVVLMRTQQYEDIARPFLGANCMHRDPRPSRLRVVPEPVQEPSVSGRLS